MCTCMPGTVDLILELTNYVSTIECEYAYILLENVMTN